MIQYVGRLWGVLLYRFFWGEIDCEIGRAYEVAHM